MGVGGSICVDKCGIYICIKKKKYIYIYPKVRILTRITCVSSTKQKGWYFMVARYDTISSGWKKQQKE